ncbi:MAG TPA: hypothetical protein VF556_14345 [Pyrinomonadaceae bacterium]
MEARNNFDFPVSLVITIILGIIIIIFTLGVNDLGNTIERFVG